MAREPSQALYSPLRVFFPPSGLPERPKVILHRNELLGVLFINANPWSSPQDLLHSSGLVFALNRNTIKKKKSNYAETELKKKKKASTLA